MRFCLITLIIMTAFVSACNTLPYAVPRPIEEPPIIAPVIDKPVIEPPSNVPPVGVPQQSDVLPEVTASLRTCRRADECVKIKADCCGCGAGGTAAAINNEYLANWLSTLEMKCQTIACLAVMSDHWTCKVEPKCVKNKCTLVKP